MTRQRVFGGITHDGITKAIKSNLHVTAKMKFTHDDVRNGSRQYDDNYGGELTASELTLDAVRPNNLYIVFDFSFIGCNFERTKILDEFYCIFEGFKPLFHPCLIEDKFSNNHSICLCVV